MGGLAHKVAAAISKETRLIMRDREALLILFIMPIAFVVIMSLALQDAFSERAGVHFPLLIVNRDQGAVGRAIVSAFSTSKFFAVHVADAHDHAPMPDANEVRKDLVAGHYEFAIVVPVDATRQAVTRIQQRLGLAQHQLPVALPVKLQLMADPTIRADHRELVAAALNRILQRIESQMLLQQIAQVGRRITAATGGGPGVPALRAPKTMDAFAELSAGSEMAGGAGVPIPTSVQQNAPAWTLLAMFFLVVPLSVTFIKERQQGSLIRLQSMPVPAWVMLAGKIAPYFVINQIQVTIIFLVGKYVLPHLGGEALEIGHAPEAIALVSMAASLAAIGFGLVVATFARTQEQATTFGATSVLILAAIGGVMVPKLVMPSLLQKVANISPLSWGLDGFLDIFVRGGGVHQVIPAVAKMMTFAAICFVIAAVRFRIVLRRG